MTRSKFLTKSLTSFPLLSLNAYSLFVTSVAPTSSTLDLTRRTIPLFLTLSLVFYHDEERNPDLADPIPLVLSVSLQTPKPPPWNEGSLLSIQNILRSITDTHSGPIFLLLYLNFHSRFEWTLSLLTVILRIISVPVKLRVNFTVSLWTLKKGP